MGTVSAASILPIHKTLNTEQVPRDPSYPREGCPPVSSRRGLRLGEQVCVCVGGGVGCVGCVCLLEKYMQVLSADTRAFSYTYVRDIHCNACL